MAAEFFLECCLGIELIRPWKIFQLQHSPHNSVTVRPWGMNGPIIVTLFHHRGVGAALFFNSSLDCWWLSCFNGCLLNRTNISYLDESL